MHGMTQKSSKHSRNLPMQPRGFGGFRWQPKSANTASAKSHNENKQNPTSLFYNSGVFGQQ
jgi:hypothetical protein